MKFIKYLFRLLLWLSAVAFGPVGYFLSSKFNILVSVYGNIIDGYCGDSNYQSLEAKKWFRRLWPCFWWSVIRNPANNLARSLASSGVVTSSIRGSVFHTATISGDKLWFFYTPHWPIMFKFGYKLWDDITVSKIYTAKLAFSIQRGRPAQ